MGEVLKLKSKRYTAAECIADIVEHTDRTASLIVVSIDHNGEIHIGGSRMTNAELCMCSTVLQIYMQDYLRVEAE